MLSIEVDYGYGNSAKGGRSLPVNVTFSNNGAAVSGTVEILTRESNGEIYAYDYPVEIAASGRSGAHYVIPLGAGSNEIAVRVVDQSGTVQAAESVHLNMSETSPELFVGILSEDPDSLSYLDGASINYGQMRTHAIQLDAAAFPTDRTELDLFDVIVISNFRVSDLNVEQMRALMQWMRDGGVLMFGTGGSVDDTLGVFAPEFLDDMYEDPVIMDLNMEENQSVDTPGSSTVTLSIVNFTLHGGSTVLSAESVPLIQTAGKGSGVLAVASFDFGELSEYAASHSSFVDLMMTRVLGTTRLDTLTSEAYGTEREEFWSAQSLIDSGSPDQVPNPLFFGAVLLLYIALLGPVLYLVMKRHHLALHYRKAAAGLGILFAVILAAAGTKTRFSDTFYSYARIREAGEDSLYDISYLNLRNPYNGVYTAELPGDVWIKPITAAESTVKNAEITGDETADVTIQNAGSRKIITANSSTAFDSRLFKITSGAANADGEGFTGNLTLFGDSCTGEITNNFPYTVTNAAVLLYGKMIPLGTIEPGETVQVDDLILYHTPLNNTYAVAAFLCGVYDGTTDQDAHVIALQRANFLSFYLSSYINTGYQQDARVIGFTESSGAAGSGSSAGSGESGTSDGTSDAILLDTSLRNSGMTLAASTAEVGNRSGSLVSRSALSSSPQVLSGDYIASTNSFYQGEPVVLAYSLGSDIRVTEVHIEEPDPVFDGTDSEGGSNFRGTISFYNYNSGSFDDVEEGKSVFTASELRQYLSPDNTLTVRYAETAEQNASRLDTALPMLTVIGEEY